MNWYKNKYHLLFGPILLITAQQCHTQNQPALSGQITVPTGFRPVVYLVQPRSFGEIATSYSGTILDSAMVQRDDRFTFERFQAPEEATFYELVIQRKNSKYANKLTDESPDIANYFPVVLQKGRTIRLVADGDQLLVSGALETDDPDNRAVRQLINIRRTAFDSFLRSPSRDVHLEENALLESAASLEKYRHPVMAFADTTQSFYAALLAVRWVSPESDYERVPEFLKKQCQRWQKDQPEHPFTQQLCALCAPGKLPLMIGDTIPNFALPTVNGDTVLLHTLLGKRVTIIDLWATWCAPCRRENRLVLLPLWQKNKDKGLQIIGYALDSNADAWKAAIQKDGAIWPQTSHLSGDSSPFLDALQVTTIPANFILDSHGIIIAKNVHGALLDQVVSD